MFEGLEFKTESSKDFAEIWAQLPKQDFVANRSDFDPMRLRKSLSGVSINEVFDDGRITFRLAGTEIVSSLGREVTGTDYLSLWREEVRGEVYQLFQTLLSYPCAIAAELKATKTSGAEIKNFSIGFPVRNAQGVVNQVLFHTSALDTSNLYESADDPANGLELIRMTFVDIGAGAPKM